MARSRIAAGMLIAVVLAVYLGVSLRSLETVPPVHEDEPWQASVGWKVARDGVFGSDLFAGYFGMERRYYAFMPVHPLLEAAVFRAAGVGLLQARLETVGLGLLLLIATAIAAWLLFDVEVAAGAMAVLVAVRCCPIDAYHLTGLAVIDGARIARYDVAASVFGVASLIAYLVGRRQRAGAWFCLSGVMVALSGLSHVYGFFWLPALVLLAVWNRDRVGHVTALVAGTLAGLVPYLAYVLSDTTTWLLQTRQYANRIDVLDPTWYLSNLAREPVRYGVSRFARQASLISPGLWIGLAGPLAAVVVLARRGLRGREESARAVVAPAVVLPAALGLLVSQKSPSYLLLVAPVAAIALAWGAVALWRAAGGWRKIVRSALVVVACAAAVEGVGALCTLEQRARLTTPYPSLIRALRSEIPAGSTVLVLHRYWFGLEDLDVRSWWVPFALAHAETADGPAALAKSLDGIAPGVIIIDDDVQRALEQDPDLERSVGQFLDRNRFEIVGTVTDTTYGTLEILSRELP